MRNRILLVLLTIIFMSTEAYALSLTRVKTWTTEILTHTDLNAEFDNILDHEIVNADVSSTAAITGSKITPTFEADTSPSSDGTYDLGIVGAEWQDVLSDGVIYSDDIKLDGTILILEQAGADTDVAGYGQIWVNTATPNELWFTNDAGTDFQLGTGDSLDGWIIGPNGDYTTIQAALTAKATAGETFYIADGATYTEAVTFTADNQSIIGLGNAENTIITQATAAAVSFSTFSGCTLANITVSVTAADTATDYCINSANDSATDYNIIENCIIDWDSSAALSNAMIINITDGNHILRNNIITANNTYASTTESEFEIIHYEPTDKLWVYDNRITGVNSATSATGRTIALNMGVGGAATWYCLNNVITMTSAVATSAETICLGANNTTGYIIGNTLITTNSSTGIAYGIEGDANTETFYIMGNSINATTSDGDGAWLDGGSVAYATGNIVTGDCAYTAASTPYVNANQILETMIFGGGDNIATATEVDAFFYNGIAIGTDNDNNILDDATHGSGVGTLYLGNATVDATFTGFHYYRLGDTNLKMGELVKLVDGKLYRSNTVQDPAVIGLYCGLTNWKDSLGTELIDGEETNKEYEEYDKVEKKWKTKIKKVKDYGKSVNKKTNQPVQPLDYAYSVAVVGDSMHENMDNPLEGAWVTTDAGTIKNGDYLYSSAKAGYLEKQVDDVMHSYTIGKAREDINKDTKNGYIYLLQ